MMILGVLAFLALLPLAWRGAVFLVKAICFAVFCVLIVAMFSSGN